MNLENFIAVSLWMILPLGLIGSLLHFLFDWTRHKRFAAILGAVNESYWEHIKIAFWPVFLLQVVLFAIGGYQYPSFIPAATIALYSLPISMVGIVYLYKMLTKRNILWIDITVFFVIIALAQVLFTLVLRDLNASMPTVVISAVFLVGIVVSFLVFTVRPPKEPDLFIDPINQHYGLKAHPDFDSEATRGQ